MEESGPKTDDPGDGLAAGSADGLAHRADKGNIQHAPAPAIASAPAAAVETPPSPENADVPPPVHEDQLDAAENARRKPGEVWRLDILFLFIYVVASILAVWLAVFVIRHLHLHLPPHWHH